jgi:hypothetical protein|tara:strand:- start:10956 stop:11741 length:786 start_codon:yes stop_codon:yes gene_type:complete
MFGHNPLTYGNIGNLLHRAETKIFMGTQYDQDTTDTSMDVRIKWDYATESYHWIASPYTNWQDTGVTKANQVKTVDTEQDGAVSGGIQRRLEDGYGLKFESLNPDEMETVSHSTALNSFEKHTNKSLYPGLGSSDLYKPDERTTIKGVGGCAEKCLEDPDCMAFHHWYSHPEAQHEDFCYYWSKAMNVAEQIESLEDRLGEGDEGKGNGHQVNAYIKSPNGDDTDDNTTQGEKTEQGTSWRMGIVAVIVIGGVFALTSQYR